MKMVGTSRPGYIDLIAPIGAMCGLYPNVPSSMRYFDAIDHKNALPPSSVVETDGKICYSYRELPLGVYHYGVSMEGYTAVCQIVNYTKEKADVGLMLNVELSPMSGNGYESGYIMLNTQEFIDKCLVSHEDAWGAEYTHLFHTPQFGRKKTSPGHHQQTTNEEIYDFISNLHTGCKHMHVYTLGKSPKYGYAMPLVLFTQENVDGLTLQQAAKLIRSNGKPTVQYAAQVHSNEPVSAEGALAMMLSLSNEKKSLLEQIDVYIVPRINLDGAVEVIRQSPYTGEDMNRDYLYMHNHELRILNSAYNLFLPELCIDGHEKKTDFLNTGTSRCTDMEVQVGAGSLNHPADMTKKAMEIALAAIDKARSLGLRGHFYANLASAAGGAAGSSYYGTRNSLSFLVETPGGTTLGNCCMARRVLSQYVLASTVMTYAAENGKEIMQLVHGSRKFMADKGAVYDEEDLMVVEHGNAPTGSISMTMINVLTGEPAEECDIAYNEQPVAIRARPRPTAYVIPKGLAYEKAILDLLDFHGLFYYALEAGKSVALRQYRILGDEVLLTEENGTFFENGAYVFPNTVPSTILCMLMEPDYSAKAKRKMTIYSMDYIAPDDEGYLPLYRYCHNLVDGKIKA